MTFLQSLIYSLLLFSSSVDERQLLGTWSFVEKKDQIAHYEKLDTAHTMATRGNMHMYTFEKGGKLTIHQVHISGFCGTPPHSFRAIPGTWYKKGDQLQIEYTPVPMQSDFGDIQPRVRSDHKIAKTQNIRLFYTIRSLDHGLMKLERVLPIR